MAKKAYTARQTRYCVHQTMQYLRRRLPKLKDGDEAKVVVGIDPSRDKPGYCIMAHGAVGDWGSLTFGKDDGRATKLGKFSCKVRLMLNQVEPMVMAFEATVVSGGPRSRSGAFTGMKAVANSVGALLTAPVYSMYDPVIMPINPSTAKKAYGVVGDTKPIKEIEKRYRLDLDGDEDAADAIAIASVASAVLDLAQDDRWDEAFDDTAVRLMLKEFVSQSPIHEAAVKVASTKAVVSENNPNAGANLHSRVKKR